MGFPKTDMIIPIIDNFRSETSYKADFPVFQKKYPLKSLKQKSPEKPGFEER